MKKLANVELYSVLYRAGMKITGPRVEILRILYELDAPVGVPELFEVAVHRNITHATAYRTLDAFAVAGIVRKVDLRHGHVDYELVYDNHDHHHIVCTGCGKIEDFDGCEMEQVIKKALKGSKDFKEVSDHALELFGTCRGCVSK